MVYSLTWLAAVLKGAGLKVAVVDGWESRGRVEMGNVAGVMCHHTATQGAKTANMPTLGTLVKGRPDLAGPLAQLGLGRDGTYYVIAAGRCNHAGTGKWRDIELGNSRFIGIEAEHSGLASDAWPEVQLDAYRRGVAAILKHIGRSAEYCCGHKEYALPPGRKPDPNFDMKAFRAAVDGILGGTAPVPLLIPATEEAKGRPTLRRGDHEDLVEEVQKKVGAEVDGLFGPLTEAKVRTFQRDRGLVPDGIVGPKTWAALDAV